MKFGLTQETNLPKGKIQKINELSDSLEAYFASRDYGNDVKEVLIGVISVKPEFDFFYKVRRLQYIANESFKNDMEESIEISKSLSYDIKLNYEKLMSISEEMVQGVLAKEVISSLKNFDQLPKKINSFDKERFKKDLEQYFREQNLI